ncbi:hypothetical protein HaLaN_20610, partial [Haematococcus lacustris]
MAKKKRKGSDKKQKGVCPQPTCLVPPKASNDRSAGMAGPRVDVRCRPRLMCPRTVIKVPEGAVLPDQDGGRVVLVDEHRTTRVSSAVNGKQPCEVELNKLSATRPAGWKPPAGQVEPRLVRPAWSQERGQPVRGLMWCP